MTSPDSEPTWEVCDKQDATRMRLPCVNQEAAIDVAATYARIAHAQGLIIAAEGKDVVVFSDSKLFSEADTSQFFIFGTSRQRIRYEREV